MGVTLIKSLLDQTWGMGSSGEMAWRGSGELGGGYLGLVNLTPRSFWTRCPMMVALAEGKYLVALARVGPGHDE